ncbi:sensor histidine kinase [Noviherbaspirillum galbum]|uniref:Sensor histidine kinase n=1 Tax=Noviherbaspirillum galbum TaxID=2709383 RepID=A0A6B3SYR9_9BURK|nr:sensor histidine kinase [Noviherbaspirillum galbum]NEX63269.1 sensor histidine kinase [Noviherbaspirillum galbum]
MSLPASQRRFSASLAAMLILGAGLALSSVAALRLHAAEQDRADLDFRQETEKYAQALAENVRDVEVALTTLGRFLGIAPGMDARAFNSLARPMLAELPGTEMMTYAAPGSAGGSRTLSTEDVPPAVQPLLQETAQRAMLRGQPATAYMRAGAEGEAGAGVMIIAAPLPQGPPGGYTAATLRIDALARRTIRSSRLGDAAKVAIIDVRPGQPETLLFASDKPAGTGGDGKDGILARGKGVVSWPVAMADGIWRVDMAKTASGTPFLTAFLVLVAGSSLSVLCAVYVLRLGDWSRSLARANLMLESDVQARVLSEAALKQSQRELRDLANYQERVKEDERKRIAREIHDDLGQNLMVLRLDVSGLLQPGAEDPQVNERLHLVLKQIDITIRSVRSIINNLRPSVLDLGLLAAIEWQVKEMNARHGVQFMLQAEREDIGDMLNDEQATSTFRIVQEAMSNVVRHANARHAWIRLSAGGGGLRIVIEDDGTGRYPGDQRKPRSFGLIGIKERVAAMGGDVEISGMHGQGTILILTLPRAENLERKPSSPALNT